MLVQSDFRKDIPNAFKRYLYLQLTTVMIKIANSFIKVMVVADQRMSQQELIVLKKLLKIV